MIAEADRRRRTIHLLIVRPDGAAILAARRAPGGASIALPSLEIDVNDDVPEAAPLLAAIETFLGVDVPVLRIVPLGLIRPTPYLVELEPAQPEPVPVGYRWVPMDDLETTAIEPATVATALERWRSEPGRDGPSPGRPPWSVPGWFGRASAWIASRLAEAGLVPTSGPRLFSLWGLSALVAVETNEGRVYLKSCSPVFPAEPRITSGLGRRTPALVPSVIAIAPEEGWLLMREIGGLPIGDGPPGTWASGLETLATIQQAWIGGGSELAGIGCEIRGAAAIAKILPALVADDQLLTGLQPAERRKLELAVPAILAASLRLDGLGPPDTLIHGDFHPWNVNRTPAGNVVFDWSDSAIGHPFIDVAPCVSRTNDVVARRSMAAAYLERWAGFDTQPVLEEALGLALVVGSFHQLESYRRILAGLASEDRWDLGEAPAQWVHAALGFLDGASTPRSPSTTDARPAQAALASAAERDR